MVLNTEGKAALFGFSFNVKEQLWFLSVSSITKGKQNEQEAKQKWNPLHGNLSWHENQVSSLWEEWPRFLVAGKEKS